MTWESILSYITIDSVLRAVALVGSVIAFLLYIKTELTQLKAEMIQVREQQKLLMDSIKQLNFILTQIAVQEARLNMIEKDIDELRHGQGFIRSASL